MPETYIEAFTSGDPIQPTDLLNIQRKESGIWTNYAIPAGSVNDMLLLEVTVDIQDIVSGGTTILGAPAAGTMNLLVDGYMKYTPGTVFDGALFAVELNDTASNVMAVASFNFSPFASASLISHNPVYFLPVTSTITMVTVSPTAADGTVTLYMHYVNVFI